MRERIPLGEAIEIVLTEDEHGYEDVLADARANGGELFIVAYAITLKGDGMLRLLQDGIPGVTRIEFVTGIPKFYQRDWCGDWARSASDEIKAYFAALHPDELDESVSVAFVMDSHAKMAISDRVAYVGSANFSDASAEKKEAGVLIRNGALAQHVRERFKAVFAADIYPYKPEAASLLGACALLDESRAILIDLVADFPEHRDPETEAFGLGPDDVDLVQSWTSKAANALGLALEVVDGDALDEAGIEQPGALNPATIRGDVEALEDDAVDEFVSFSRREYIERRVQELTEQDPEQLDAASEQANQEADEELNERFGPAWLAIEPVLGRLADLPDALQTVSVAVRQALDALEYLEA